MIDASIKLNHYNDVELVALLSASDQTGFNFIYNKYKTVVFNVAMRYLKSSTIAEEVVQEVFMELWKERNNIKDGNTIKAWLCVVTKNNTLNKLKRKAVEWKAVNLIKNTQTQFDDSTQDNLKSKDCNHLLEKALKNLSENQQKVFRLSREENQSYLQIAEHLNISPLTVKTHMSRALFHLKSVFSKYIL